jgi:valine--pyruvate aminotransferase
LGGAVLRPWYSQQAELAVTCLQAALGTVPFRIHKPEGAFFLWLWLPGLPITCVQLFEKLKLVGVLVIPGHSSFPGLQEPWQHTQQCIRISYAVDAQVLQKGLQMIGQVVQEVYAHAG